MKKSYKIGEGGFETVDGKYIARVIWKEEHIDDVGREFIIIKGRRQYRKGRSQFGRNYYLKHFIRM
jgi:hypothetical protein